MLNDGTVSSAFRVSSVCVERERSSCAYFISSVTSLTLPFLPVLSTAV